MDKIVAMGASFVVLAVFGCTDPEARERCYSGLNCLCNSGETDAECEIGLVCSEQGICIDGEGYAEADGDADADADSDADADADGDADADADADTDTDTDSDGDTDGDTDTDTDGDADEPCQYECSDHCLSVGGTPMDGICPAQSQKCCDLGSDSDVDTDTDADTDNDVDADADNDVDADTDNDVDADADNDVDTDVDADPTVTDKNWASEKSVCNNGTGSQGGYTYEYWKDNGNGCMELGPGGAFSIEWSNINNLLARKGLRPGSKDVVVTYAADYQPNGNSYLTIYGWTKNPLVEYYIVDSWGNWRPPGGQSMGTVDSDGGTYDIYRTERVNQPSIEGTSTFYQFWSVRKDKRTSGTITCANHFEAWAKAGLSLGSFYEVSMCVEGWQSSGTANVYSMTMK